MPRLGELDLPDRLAPAIPRWATTAAVGLICAALAILIRAGLDIVSGGAGAPFAFVYPATILAALFARWRAGAITAAVSITYAWFFWFPVRHSFRPADPEGAFAVVFIIVGAAMTIAISETFRRAAHRARIERDREIADRDLLLDEFDHRVKNNFQIVASILEIQRRRTTGDAAEALDVALHRVGSIGRAHRHLYRGSHEARAVQMRDYLRELCDALGDALSLRGRVTMVCHCDDAWMPRDRAVSIGLVVNELVTNAAKHAFDGRERGAISVMFRETPVGWTLTVADDGRGIAPREPDPAAPDDGLGSRLIPAFARQAGGTISTDSGPDGTAVTMELARDY
jgi:two-component sensor histidine kinase